MKNQNETVTVTLEKDDWIDIGKHLANTLGETTDIMPTVRLLECLAKGGVKTSELDPKGGSR